MELHQHIAGCLLGTAIGDSIGLPREGLNRRRAARLFGNRPLQQSLLMGRGLCSDDTEHTVMVAQALALSGADPLRFGQDFARRLRWWLLRLPAGVGLGTLRACLKLWCGLPPERSGVQSAGNGPAMRSALLGLVARSPEHLAALVDASTKITHTDPRAKQGAAVIAAIAQAITDTTEPRLAAETVSQIARCLVNDEVFQQKLLLAIQLGDKAADPEMMAERLGLGYGVSGFVVETVPAAVYCWFAHQGNFRNTVETAVCLGGDSDTVGAIAGALAGTQVGAAGIPQEWLDGLAEWPCTAAWMQTLAKAVAGPAWDGRSVMPPRLSPVSLLVRNMMFLPIVLAHGFRRLLPPY